MDSNGNFQWARSVSGFDNFSHALALDGTGHLFVGGNFNGTATFGSLSPITSNSQHSAFVWKLDANTGNSLAVTQIDGNTNGGYGLAVDNAGNIFSTGDFSGTLQLGSTTLSAISNSGYICKYDNNLNIMWAQGFGGTTSGNNAEGTCLAVDAAGNAYVTGFFNGTGDFGSTILTTTSGNDAFVCKLDSTGNFLWAGNFGGSAAQDQAYGIGIALDNFANVYITGSFKGSAAGFGLSLKSTYYRTSGYVIQLDTNGNGMAAGGFGLSSGTNYGLAITLDSTGHILITGTFIGTCNFDPTGGTANLTSITTPSYSATDIFLVKLLRAGVVGVSLNPTNVNVTEGGVTDTYTVVLNSVPTANVTITLSPGSQVTVSPASLVFTPTNWSTAQIVMVTAVNDTVVEGLHTGTITHTAASGDTNYNNITVASVVANITDNDFPPGVTITESGGSTNVTEGGATDTYTVVLNSAPTANVTITLHPDSQVTISPTSLVFSSTNWNTPKTVTVTAVNDTVVEGPHTGTITHTTASGDTKYNNITVASVVANITDNDFPPGVTITESAGSTNVTEGGATDTYTVVLNSVPTANVTITLHPDSQVTVSPTSLVFSSTNWNTPKTVTVTAFNDTIYAGPHTGTITHTSASSDSNYGSSLTIASVVANITDNDVAPSAGVTITQSGGSTNVTEGGATDTYTVVLTAAPTANVTITLIPDSQVTVSPASLVFTPTDWNAAQTVTVTAVDDTVVEGSHTGTITHSATSSDTKYAGLTVAGVIAHITDNDSAITPGVLITPSAGSTVVINDGTTDTYTAVLKTQPTADVTITLTPGTLVSVSPVTLVFTTIDWNVPQTVTVTGLTPGSDTITHSASSSDSNYNGSGVAIASVPVTILDKTGYLVTGTTGNDIITVTPSADLSHLLVTVNGKIAFVPATVTQLVIDAGNGNDTIQLNNPIVPVFVDAGLGTDSLTVNGQTAANNFVLDNLTLTANSHVTTMYSVENLTVNGMANSDTFAVTTNPDPSIKNISFNGGLGSDSFTGPDTATAWKITTSNSGLVNGVIKFASIENLTGGSGNDTFSFTAGKNISGKLDGGAGTDVLDESLFTTPLTYNLQTGSATGTAGIQNIETILAGKSASDKLIGPDGTQTWNITAKNAGNVNGTFYQNIENLTGGSGDDTFTFADTASLTGKLDGGPGTADALDYSAYSTPISFNLQTKKATAITGGFANIEAVTGGSASNTLTAANKTNTWNIATANAGTFADGTTTFTFAGFANLIGGSSSDTFTLTGSLTGTLNGGLGLDTLIAGGTGNHTWAITALNAGTLDGQPFTAIENLQGGGGDDLFTFSPRSSLTGKIDGGLGNNTLDYSTLTTAVSINLATGKATGTTGILNLDRFLAGSNLNNFLYAPNLSNAWNLTATNAGNFTNSAGTYNFTNFQNLTGGSQDDAFTLALADGWTGYLQGGLGSDTLTAFGTGNTWTATTLNGHKFGSIENTL